MNLDVILVAVDFSEISQQVYEVAAEVSARLRARIVVVLNVTEPQLDYAGLAAPQAYASADEELQKLVDARLNVAREFLEQRGLQVEGEHQWGPVVDSILERAKKWEAGLIIVGSHGHGAMYDLLVGSVADGVIRHSHLPVLVVPNARAKTPEAATVASVPKSDHTLTETPMPFSEAIVLP